MKKLIRALTILVLLTSQAAAQTSFIETSLTAGNACDGSFFDITAKNEDIRVVQFGINIDSLNAADTTTVYYKRGTYQSFEENSAPWTVLGSANVTGQKNVETNLKVGEVLISAGTTTGFFIFHSGRELQYRDGTINNSFFENDDVSLLTMNSHCGSGPFTGVNNRRFSGRVYYQIEGQMCIPVEAGNGVTLVCV